MSLSDDIGRVRFSNQSFLVCIIVGVLMTIGVIFLANSPSNIVEGEKAKEAIQMLDAMRRPFLKIKEAEIKLVETGDVKAASDNFTEARKSAEVLLEKYLQLSQYNPEVHDNVTGLRKEYNKWMIEESHLFNLYAEVSRLADESVLKDHFIVKLSTASSHFMSTMNRLGDAEVPIHNDMDVGSRAVRFLMVSLGLFFLYLMGLIFFYQAVKKGEVGRAYNKLQEEVEERSRAKKGLRETEDRYRRLFHSSNDAIIIYALQGRILDANQKALELFGYNEPEIKSLTIRNLEPSRAASSEVMTCEDMALAGKIHYEVDFKKRGGEIFRAEVSVAHFEMEGKKVFQAIIRDITERRRPRVLRVR